MRRHCLRILIVLISVAGLGRTTRGQLPDQIEVNINHDLVVAGKTLPAGIYRVSRLGDTNQVTLMLTSVESLARVMVNSTAVETTRAKRLEVSFQLVAGQHFLSKIETAEHAFTIPVTRSEILEAAARSHSGTSASGRAAGSN